MNFRNMQKNGAKETEKEISTQKSKVLRNYKKALMNSKKKIRSFWKELQNIPPEQWAESKLTELIILLNELSRIYKSFSGPANKEILDAALVGISNNYYRQYYTLSWFTPNAARPVNLDFQLLDPLAIQLSVFGIRGRISDIKNDDRKKILENMVPQKKRPKLENVLEKNDKEANSRIRDSVTVSFLKGEGITETIEGVNQSYNTINNISQRVVDTESHRNLNAAFYLAAAYVGLKTVAARIIQSILDNRTRPQSIAVDNQSDQGRGFFVYPGGVIVSYPGNSGIAGWDINDRETTITSLLGIENTDRVGINPHTGRKEISTYKSFDDWAASHKLKKNVYYQPVTKPEVFRIAEAQAI